MLGVHVSSGRELSNVVRMRRDCRPRISLNGMPLPADASDDIDNLVHPQSVTAMEVYSGMFTPAVYDGGGCGSVVFWVGMSPM